MDKFSIPTCSAIFQSRVEYKDASDFFLPDFAQSSARVIGADGFSYVSNVIFEDGFLKFTLNTTVKVAYLSEQNGYIKSVFFPFSKEKSLEVRGISGEDALPDVCAVCVYACAKQKSPRNFEITVGNHVNASIYSKNDVAVFNPEGVSDAELHSEKITASEHGLFFDYPESVSFETPIDENMPHIAEIADSSLILSVENSYISGEKIKYRAKASLSCVFRGQNAVDSEESAANYVYFSKDFPFEGSFDAPGVPESAQVLTKLTLLEYDCSSLFDPYGESRIIGVNMRYSVKSDVFFSVEKEFSDDGYSPLYECTSKSETYSYERLSDAFEEKCTISGALRYDSVPLVSINSHQAQILPSGVEVSDDKLFFTGKLYVTVCGTDEKGEARFVSGSIPVRAPIQSGVLPANKKFFTECSLLFCDAVLQNGEISINAEIYLKCVVVEKAKIIALSDFEVNYDSPKQMRKNEYVLYYPDENDTLWSIGKKYEVPVSVIKSENSMESDVIKGRKVIKIPMK
ncbi:MAG: LysM peptidoglycan-binding domain-containing protein [Clostridiales bacterium]|nr:LysM peptidoglycan-binding domain-containing protein [Clostridiales bacterium]